MDTLLRLAGSLDAMVCKPRKEIAEKVSKCLNVKPSRAYHIVQ